MKLLTFLSAMLALAAVGAADQTTPRLTITATTPKISIAPQAEGRQFIELPDLTYHFLLEPRCPRGWETRAVTLSIADSRQVLDGRTLDEHGLMRASLAPPASQLAPLPVSRFCEIGDELTNELGRSRKALKISSALSVHAGLICASADAERTHYQSRPLAVTLLCDETTDPS